MTPQITTRRRFHSWRVAATCIHVLIGVLALPSATLAQETIQDLTTRLIAMAEQLPAAADRGSAGEALLAVARRRALLLEALIERDPGLALQVSLPQQTIDRLPATVRNTVEGRVDLEGTLEVLVEDLPEGRQRVLYTLSTGVEQVALHFADDPPYAQSGSRARVRGVRAGQALALESGSTSFQMVMPVLANSLGEQRTLVLLVNFQDNVIQPYTASHAWNVVFRQTHEFYNENSFGQTSLTGDVFGWFTLPLSSTVCDSARIATLSRQAAAAAGINLSAYNRFVYGFPKNACSWWGLGSLGGTPSNAWVNGPFELRVVGHEIGHNLGLGHAASLDCGPESLGASCTVSEYGDTSDIMGASAFHFQAFHKERLGWLNAGGFPPLETVQTSGTYYVAPFEQWTTTSKGLKVLRNIDSRSGKPVWYYVEFRRPLGYDSGMGAGLTSGALIHLASEAGGNRSYLIDATSTDSFADAALTVGQTFADPYVGLRITVTTATTGGLLVAVAYDAAACAGTPPSVSLSPGGTTWVAPGTPVTYSATIANNDGQGCAPSTFNIVPVVPSGWTATATLATVTLAPGTTSATSVTISSNSATPAGTYDVGVSAVDIAKSTRQATALVKQSVVGALSVTVQTSSVTYQHGDTVTLTAKLTSGGAAVPNAAVTFFVTRPDGYTESLATVTDPYGTATYQWKVNRRDPAGSYAVRARGATLATSTEAATSFIVQ